MTGSLLARSLLIAVTAGKRAAASEASGAAHRAARWVGLSWQPMPTLQRHVFVCTNERAPGNPKGDCKSKGAGAVRDELKKRLAALGLKGIVRANNAGCLDQCATGVTIVVYPEQVWYGHVTVADVPEIIERHLLGGEFVERLMLPDQPHLQGRTRAEPAVVLKKEK
jgi:(2Fe-2S) ferredoxin